jgi:periplasmic protein TonB
MLNSTLTSALLIQHSALQEGGPMPQEFLRDVLRTGDATNRARRRLSVLPVSIAAHAIAVTAFMMSPFFTAVEMPAIASTRPDWVPTVAPTPPSPPPPARTAPEVVNNAAAPIAAPDRIAPEHEPQPRSEGPGVIGSIAVGVETGGSALLATTNIGETPAAPILPPAPPTGPVRVGGVIREPRRISQVPPLYPEIARATRIQGTVILEALLDVTGKVESVRVLKSIPLLDEAAVSAVRQWRYTPTQLNGVAVPVLMTITVNFTLER